VLELNFNYKFLEFYFYFIIKTGCGYDLMLIW